MINNSGRWGVWECGRESPSPVPALKKTRRMMRKIHTTIKWVALLLLVMMSTHALAQVKYTFDEWMQEAKAGSVLAQSVVGTYYYAGLEGVKQDYGEARKWFRLAADQGDLESQYQMGNFYYEGWGVEKDYVEAVRWFRMAAEEGYAPAQRALGDCYLTGYGVDRDDVEGVRLYKAAAEQEDAVAQFVMAYCYAEGKYGVRKNKKEAFNWYLRTAQNKSALGKKQIALAQGMVGAYYLKGIGVKKNKEEAGNWLKKAAANGNQDAKLVLQRYGLW